MRLIDADKLKDEFIGKQELWHYTGIRAWIDSAPTVDAVKVVRCSDCKYYNQIGKTMLCEWWHFSITKADDFCSYGERKEDDR